MNLWRYLAKRLLLMVPTLLGILLVTFVVIQFVPGGPVEQLAQELRQSGGQGETVQAAHGLYRASGGLNDERLAELRALYGFDQPAWKRFADMVRRYATFDLGQSFYHHQSVWGLVVSKLPVSMSLGLWTFFLT